MNYETLRKEQENLVSIA